MRGVVLVALAVLVSAALSGCVSEKDGDGPEAQSVPTSSSASKSGTATTSATTTTGKAPSNKTVAPAAAPTANLTASTLNGTAPLNVTFTVSGTSASGSLAWVLSSNGTRLGNGTKVPTNVTHTFAAAGNFTVLLSVSDGRQNATANVTVTVRSGGAAAAAFTPIHAEFDVAVFCELCTDLGPENCASLQAGVAGIDCGWVELPAAAAGRAFTVATHGLATGNADIAFLAACDAGAAVVAVQTEAATETGVVPAGAGCLVAWDYDGVEPALPFTVDVA